MRRAVAYCRVSSEGQQSEGTIGLQVDAIKDWLQRRDDLTLVEWYLDEGYSGSLPFDQRPRGAELLRDAAEGKFDVVLVYKTDRIARDDLYFQVFKHELRERNITIMSITEPYDVSTPSGDFTAGLLSLVAAFDRRNILDRSVAGKARVAKMGKWPNGGIPYGYYADDRGFLQIREEEAETVRLIYKWYTDEHWKIREIACELDARGIPPSNVARQYKSEKGWAGEWLRSQIHRILENPVYHGEAEYKSKAEGLIIIHVPAIVPREQWERAQIRKKEQRTYPGRNPANILRGKIFCGMCGRAYVGALGGRSGKIRYYKCTGLDTDSPVNRRKCNARFMRAVPLEEWVWAQIMEVIEHPGDIVEELVVSQGEAEAELGEIDSKVRDIERRIAMEMSNRKTTISLCAKGLITESDLQEQLAEIERETKGLRAKKEGLLGRQKELLNQEAQLEQVRETLEQLGQYREVTEEKDKRVLIEMLVNKVVVMPGEDGKPAAQLLLAVGGSKLSQGLRSRPRSPSLPFAAC
ncbi:MAG: recombinase family protein [Anaerolineae bacterium]